MAGLKEALVVPDTTSGEGDADPLLQRPIGAGPRGFNLHGAVLFGQTRDWNTPLKPPTSGVTAGVPIEYEFAKTWGNQARL